MSIAAGYDWKHSIRPAPNMLKRTRPIDRFNQLLHNKRRRFGAAPRAVVPALHGSMRSKSRSGRLHNLVQRKRKRNKNGGKGYTRRFSRKVRNVMMYDANPPAVYKIRYSGRLNSAAQEQSLGLLQAAGPTVVSTAYSPQDLIAIRVAWAASIGANENTKYQIVKWKQDYQFHNHTNTEMTLEIYHLKARYTIPNVVGADPDGCIARSLANSAKGAGSKTAIAKDYGITPYMCNAFTTSYKIYKVRKFKLEAGEYQKYTFRAPSRKSINTARYENFTTPSTLIYAEPDKWRALMFRVYGAPVNSAATKTEVNVCETGLDWTMIETVQVAWNIYQNYQQYYFNTGATSFPNLTVPTTMSAAAGIPVTVGTA